METKETSLPVITAPTLMSYRPAQLLFEAAIGMLAQFDRLDLTRFGADRAALDVAVQAAMGAIAEREEHRSRIDEARDEHATDELEIDDDPVVSESEGFGGDPGGLWISAWIYIPNPDNEEDEKPEPAGATCPANSEGHINDGTDICVNCRGDLNAECAHDWVCTGTEAGGDDARFHGEGRMLCSKCGADGDA